MKGSDFDEAEFFRAIQESRVRALLIGRRALVALGIPVLTADYDFWIHIEDIARAFLALAEADRDLVHDEAFNVGTTTENYMIRDVAHLVEEVVPDCEVTLSDEAFNDPRNYRVTCDKLARTIPGFKPQWTVRRGIEELYEAYVEVLAAGKGELLPASVLD